MTLLVDVVKLIHLLSVLGILSLTMTSLFFCHRPNTPRRDKLTLILLPLAFLTGLLLVYPRNYTFHTPWIIAACMMVPAIFILQYLQMRYVRGIVLKRFMLFLILILLLIVMQDAVTKQSFLLEHLHLSPHHFIKALHIISGAVFFLASIYALLPSSTAKRQQHLAVTIVMPAVCFQLLSGFTLFSLQHYTWSLLWVKGALLGFVFALLGWFLLLMQAKPRLARGLVIIGLLAMVFFMANKPV